MTAEKPDSMGEQNAMGAEYDALMRGDADPKPDVVERLRGWRSYFNELQRSTVEIDPDLLKSLTLAIETIERLRAPADEALVEVAEREALDIVHRYQPGTDTEFLAKEITRAVLSAVTDRIAAGERERCAAVCEADAVRHYNNAAATAELGDQLQTSATRRQFGNVAKHLAALIRAGGGNG